MTRKCVMCKETNYRNSYSFFSAPKDRETRQKWQEAIGIENYAVTDDTYVCSKHFHKDDIITHWASGVPPYVITIKYKKCRLRPGAIPNRKYHEDNKNEEHSDESDENSSPFKLKKSPKPKGESKDYVIPRSEEKLEINCYEKHRVIPLHYKYTREFHDHNYMPTADPTVKVDDIEDNSNVMDEESHEDSIEKNYMEIKRRKMSDANVKIESATQDSQKSKSSIAERNDQDEAGREDSNVSKRALESSSKASNVSEEGDMLVQFWEHKSKEESISNDYKEAENSSMENQMGNNYNQSECSTYNDTDETEMLFEDLIEICSEVLLPRGWSCIVTSTGHATTIVYLYMGMTKSGMPFTEKQVFIKSDLTLRCVAMNREINPLTHNLIREGKHLKVQTLVDIEELIDEFDQRMICHGINNTESFQEDSDIRIVYKDGVEWRHILCPLIMNNGSLRCTRCIALSQKLQHQSKNRHSSPDNRSRNARNDQKSNSSRRRSRRLKKPFRKLNL